MQNPINTREVTQIRRFLKTVLIPKLSKAIQISLRYGKYLYKKTLHSIFLYRVLLLKSSDYNL